MFDKKDWRNEKQNALIISEAQTHANSSDAYRHVRLSAPNFQENGLLAL